MDHRLDLESGQPKPTISQLRRSKDRAPYHAREIPHRWITRFMNQKHQAELYAAECDDWQEDYLPPLSLGVLFAQRLEIGIGSGQALDFGFVAQGSR